MHTDSEAHRQAIDLLRHIGRKPYAFQATLADQCLESVRQRERVIIVAPTGTGKTLVSQLFMALLRRELDAKPRVLVVIPSRGLVAQHFVDASWMRKTVPIALHKINADTPKYQIIETLNSFGIVFTTPITLSRRLALPGARDALRKFDCAIFDEIDVHLTVDEQAERRDTFPALDACMEAQLPILGFTGTGLTRKQIDSWERRRFRKVEAAIPDEWLPLTKVHFVGIADQHVETVDRSIKEELRLAFYKLGWEVPGLANASIGQVKKYAKLGYPSALRILDLCSKRLQLFESPGSTMGKYLALKNSLKNSRRLWC
jgi:superfamily II DNA or RNA helicase